MITNRITIGHAFFMFCLHSSFALPLEALLPFAKNSGPKHGFEHQAQHEEYPSSDRHAKSVARDCRKKTTDDNQYSWKDFHDVYPHIGWTFFKSSV